MEKNNSLLEVKGLVVQYSSDNQIVHAVNGVSLQIGAGETVGLVGETGAGKTSIAKAILRILPDVSAKITGGEILFEGEDILLKPKQALQKIRGEKISMIFQDPMTALNPVKSVGKQVAAVIALHNPGLSKAKAWEKAKDMLASVGIAEDRMREYPHQFSGGMKQRVLIAMALACDPILLLADEPTTALDVTIQAQVLEMIQELKNARNMSMLLITHDLAIVAENCDKVAVIYAGRIVESGTVEEVFLKPMHPYTCGLFNAIPDLEGEDEWLQPIDGLPPDPTKLPAGCSFAPRCPFKTDRCEKTQPELECTDGSHMVSCFNKNLVQGE